MPGSSPGMTGWKSSAVGTANPTGAYYRLISQANLTASLIGSAIGQIESPGSAGLGQADRQAGRRSDPFKRTLKMKKLMTILVAGRRPAAADLRLLPLPLSVRLGVLGLRLGFAERGANSASRFWDRVG